MGYTGIDYASTTLASAIGNLTPAFTFILAIIVRMEKVSLPSKSSQAKIVGTVVTTFYKGPSINAAPMPPVSQLQLDWIIGSLLLMAEYLLAPVWFVLMAHVIKEYPAELTIIFFHDSTMSILAAVVGVFAEPDSTNVSLASILCSGVLRCCLYNVAQTWALHLRGPVYVAMFSPLFIVIAAAMGVIILSDNLYLGSIIGATVIATGFYTMLWVKTKEEDLGNEFDTPCIPKAILCYDVTHRKSRTVDDL